MTAVATTTAAAGMMIAAAGMMIAVVGMMTAAVEMTIVAVETTIVAVEKTIVVEMMIAAVSWPPGEPSAGVFLPAGGRRGSWLPCPSRLGL